MTRMPSFLAWSVQFSVPRRPSNAATPSGLVSRSILPLRLGFEVRLEDRLQHPFSEEAPGAGMAKGVSTPMGDLDPEGGEPAVDNIIDAAGPLRSGDTGMHKKT